MNNARTKADGYYLVVEFRIANGSNATVFDLEFDLRDADPQARFELRELPAGATAHGTAELSFEEAEDSLSMELRPVLRFTDAMGRRWRRKGGGQRLTRERSASVYNAVSMSMRTPHPHR